MSEWISVKDRLPSDGELVIASGNRRKEFGGGKWVEPVVWADNDFHAPMFDSDEEDIVANFDCWMHDTTHWQPMPPPPAEGE